MKMYHVHFTDVKFVTIEKILYYMGSFPFLIFTLLTCSLCLFFLVMNSVYHYIYIWFSCIIFFSIVIISLIKWLINYLTVNLIDDSYNAYSTRIAFFLNSVIIIANLQEPNWVGQTLYLFLQVSNIIANMILSLSYDIISYKFCTVQYLLLVN